MNIDAHSPLDARTWTEMLRLAEHLMSVTAAAGGESDSSVDVRLRSGTQFRWHQLLHAFGPPWASEAIRLYVVLVTSAMDWGLPPGEPDRTSQTQLSILSALNSRFVDEFSAQAQHPVLAPALDPSLKTWQAAHGIDVAALTPPPEGAPEFIERGLRS